MTLKDREGRYSVKGNFDKDIKLDFIVFSTGNINFIGKKGNIANNLGTYFLGNPQSTNKTFSFDIKETINGVSPNTYFIDFFVNKLKYSNNEVSFEKISDSTNIKISERIGVYYNKDKSHSITISSDKILWSYFSDANINIDDMNSEEAVFSEIKNYENEKGEQHTVSLTLVFTDNCCKLTFNITDPQYSQYNKNEEEYRISWE